MFCKTTTARSPPPSFRCGTATDRWETQICTELLYQPLTLLDCLHTFCGACLKEWFSFQAAAAQRTPTPLTSDTSPFTCPSCRAPVRDTRHNATVVTLLDMLVAANPDKARSESDKEEMARKYTPGEQVMPKVHVRDRSAAERRADQADQRLVQEVREMSLRDARGELSVPPRSRRHRESRSADGGSGTSRGRRSLSAQRQRGESDHRPRIEDGGRRSTDQVHADEETRQRRRSDSRRRQVEHQSSLRSLISSADMNERDIEKEIEEFAKQIQEEGLLEGLDLDNIDLTRNDELSRRITEAYRRRQRERPRHSSNRRSHTSTHSTSNRPAEPTQPDSRHLAPGTNNRGSSRPRTSSSTSGHSQNEDRSRPPSSLHANLEAPSDGRRPRRRTASGGRSATTPVFPSPAEAAPAARSQTDLALVSQTSDSASIRPNLSEGRSSSMPLASGSAQVSTQTERTPEASTAKPSFADRMPPRAPSEQSRSPPELHELDSTVMAQELPAGEVVSSSSPLTNSIGSPTSPTHHRPRPHLYPEPSITCSACGTAHIEYDVHYNCPSCFGGQWNICLGCYRIGKGCHYWFGFGHAGQALWERSRKKQGDDPLSPPHILTARRYLQPPVTPGGADGRRTLTTDDPKNRLQTGTFCAKCQAWANSCYWRCDSCNDGEWGFCNDCVNQGCSCSHMLLPLTQDEAQLHSTSSNIRSHARPATASILTGSKDRSLGSFKPLTFETRCAVCQDCIPPADNRYHCFECVNLLVPDGSRGDYDICSSCYSDLVAQGHISQENGLSGWRRCLDGHRMIQTRFLESGLGQWRYVDRDLVGGRILRSESVDGAGPQGQELLKWTWNVADQKVERLVTKYVAGTAPRSHGSLTSTEGFPADGGVGAKATAKWAWYPQAGENQELMFPRGAEIAEVENINGDWMCGTYMGADGAFPAPLVVTKEDS